MIFNLYSNFCTSLVWRGWSRMICIFYMSRIILKKEENRERNEANKISSSREERLITLPG